MDAQREPACYLRVYANQVGGPVRVETSGPASDLARLLALALGDAQFQGPLIDAFLLLGGVRVLIPLGELGGAIGRGQTFDREGNPGLAGSLDEAIANGVPRSA